MFYTQWEFWVAVITAVTAVIALCQSYVQIRISNKQFLYDRRVRLYFMLLHLMGSFEKNRESINKANRKGDGWYTADFQFAELCNNAYLESIQGAARYYNDNDKQKEFLLKLDEMKINAQSFKFLFNSIDLACVEEFITTYADILYKLRQCYALIKENGKTNAEFAKVGMTHRDDPMERFDSFVQNIRLSTCVEQINKSFDQINALRLLQQIEDAIRL